MDGSPFARSGATCRTPPPSPSPKQDQVHEESIEVISTPEIQKWLSSIELYLNEVCSIASEGKLNSDQKLKISNHCRKIGHGVSQMAVQYQSLKQKAVQTHISLQSVTENRDLAVCLSELKQSIQESSARQKTASTSFADMVKKGRENYVRPNNLSSVVIYPNDTSKTSDETKTFVQKIIRPEELNLKVRAVRKIRNGGVIISTETKDDIEKLKRSVQLSTTALSVDEPAKRNPRIIILGVPAAMAESEVFKCIYEQNLAEKLPTMSRDTFMTSIKLSHKSGKKEADYCNFIIEVPAVVRKALITQERLFINWTPCRLRDYTMVTRCFKCQQYGHAAKTCKATTPSCGHCGDEGHSIQECSKKEDSPKCATCLRFKKPCSHKTGDAECPARKVAEFRYINSINYEGA